MKKAGLIIAKTVLVSIVTTFLFMLIIAFALYQWQLKEKFMPGAIVIAYFISNFIGGMIIGHITERKRYLWGAILGATYVLILIILSMAVPPAGIINGKKLAVAVAACIFGGALGGMVS